MILVDTSVWIDHLRAKDEHLSILLIAGTACIHPMVIGELALGNLVKRAAYLGFLHSLPKALVARDGEILALIDRYRLHGLGIGYVDTNLIASVLLTGGARLYTRDKRLNAAAVSLSVAANFIQ